MTPVAPPRQRLWSAARVLRHFDVTMLAMAAATTEKVATDYARLLVSSGHFVLETAGTPSAPAVYRMAKNSGPKAPYRVGGKVRDPNLIAVVGKPQRETLRQRIWAACRTLGSGFTAAAAADRAGAHRTTAADYIRQLTRSGHIGATGFDNSKAGRRTTYRVARDTGPRAPVFRNHAVYDPNTGQTHDAPSRNQTRQLNREAREAFRIADQERFA